MKSKFEYDDALNMLSSVKNGYIKNVFVQVSTETPKYKTKYFFWKKELSEEEWQKQCEKNYYAYVNSPNCPMHKFNDLLFHVHLAKEYGGTVEFSDADFRVIDAML